eukprot:Platyproteum_vivax@DN3369_c0_g1_i1.p2
MGLPTIMQFMMGVVPLLVAYGLLGFCFFWNTTQFSTMARSFITLFCVLNGDIMEDSFKNTGDFMPIVSQVYLYTFVVLFMYVVLNSFIAIIEDAFFYEKRRTELASSTYHANAAKSFHNNHHSRPSKHQKSDAGYMSPSLPNLKSYGSDGGLVDAGAINESYNGGQKVKVARSSSVCSAIVRFGPRLHALVDQAEAPLPKNCASPESEEPSSIGTDFENSPGSIRLRDRKIEEKARLTERRELLEIREKIDRILNTK